MTITRKNGYALLRSYGLLFDGRAGALVADGAADWFATPRLDAAPVCAAVLDPAEGGAIALAPCTTGHSMQRCHVGHRGTPINGNNPTSTKHFQLEISSQRP
jgi:hypothetical protein